MTHSVALLLYMTYVFFSPTPFIIREDCAWLHRLPTRQDHVESGLDVFGRERYEEHREDRGGVGSMLSDTKTLYVGKIHISPDMQAIVEKHFKAWGEIERIKILKDKGVAFVTYQSRLNAEFAKVAMTDQSLDHGEILNIRWATEDPNPRSQAIAKRKAVEMAREAIESKISGDYKQAQHLPGSEEAIIEQSEKRQRYDTNLKETQQSQPTLYIGADGLYYYDYGDYGYNFETQQYDPGRLSHSQEHNKNSIQQSQLQEESKVPSLQERIKASLLTSANAAPNPSLAISAKDKKPVPVKSALSALAGYSSDSESGSES
ncbi:Pre-mRNA-splicing factor [Lobosporangium transversale]|nr:Pre-mRNA-splicing factor [Lobosporangium transversale]